MLRAEVHYTLCYYTLASSATATCTAACHSVWFLCCLPVFLLSNVTHRSGYLTMILTAKPKTSSYRKFLKECAKCAATALRADQQPFPTQAMHLDMIEMLSLDWCTPPPPLPSSPLSLFPAYDRDAVSITPLGRSEPTMTSHSRSEPTITSHSRSESTIIVLDHSDRTIAQVEVFILPP